MDPALVEECAGEVSIMYPLTSVTNAWVTPEATEALGEHPAVEFVQPHWPLEPPWPVEPVELPWD